MSENPDSREWDAALYHQISTPQVSWGKKVLARISLRGDETVLDAGCGTGRLTRDLLEALPCGRAAAVDLSQNMLDAARAYLEPDFGGRVEFVCCDLLDMPFERRFDGIFSTASFHWVLDHDRLFRSLHRGLRPGAWLCAQCGGGSNLARLLGRVHTLIIAQPFAQYFAGYTFPWEFSDAETAASRMRRAGFEEIETSLEEAPTKFPNAQEFQQFVETVVLRNHLDRIPDRALRGQFLAELTRQAAADNPPFLLDYWRLNLQGRKPGG
ncbi:MAG TPA: methyltransferase domain-containing protein [Candidatus Acidoferrales bacterium]|jgi:trans-aconitate methyltransferase|nr:methyltransferase domain-containing protein [Candidatus Acidoferrales bacterium]